MKNDAHDLSVEQLYEKWFLDYASYVILERAIPSIEDGLKPVQRRILHAMHAIDDGRYNKVANIVGQTMQYHPHGDASITEAMVAMGQKKLLIDTQGNWGDGRTGDPAAAARYIEARLSPFSKEVLYSPQVTQWKLAYDGRKKEPHTLPIKFPLLLMQGAEGIAVGLSTKILPHNFVELLEASIAFLQGNQVVLLPDFPTGGVADCRQYKSGQRGGKVVVRAKIQIRDPCTIAITEIPYGTTTTSLIDSILQAHKKGKIKIKNVVDNTAESVEILVYFFSNQPIEQMVDALYLFTDAQVSHASNICVIQDGKPEFISVEQLLGYTVERTKHILEQELWLQEKTLQEQLLLNHLEQIFIENRIYHSIEVCQSWQDVLQTITNQLEPYLDQFYRPITQDDIAKLTEIKIKKIAKYNHDHAQEVCLNLQKMVERAQYDLAHLTAFTIHWYTHLLDKYGKGRGRKTTLAEFLPLEPQNIVQVNQKLYVNRKEGFIGYSLKGEEWVADCSEVDDVLVVRKDGKVLFTRISDKAFVGNNLLHVSIYRRLNMDAYYHMIYVDGATGVAFVKRFHLSRLVRDRVYDLTMGTPGSRILYTSENIKKIETVVVILAPLHKSAKRRFEFNFSQLAIKRRTARGNILTKYPIHRVYKKK